MKQTDTKMKPIEKKAWKLFCSGKSFSEIAKAIQKSIPTAKRYVAKAKVNLPEIEQPVKELDRLDNLVEEAWNGIEELIKSKNTPAHVKANLYLRILNTKGIMIEQKKVDHSGSIDYTEVRKTKLQEGLKSFGLLSDNPA